MSEHLDENEIEKNIFHELNKMLLSVTKETGGVNIDSSFDSHNKSNSQNERTQYYLQFPTKSREEMADLLNISSKKLSRIYEEPIQILNDYNVVKKLAEFFSFTYPKMISIFFSSQKNNNINIQQNNDSVLMNEIMAFETTRSREERRDIARILHMVMALNIDTKDFVEINSKLINKKCYNPENLNRIRSFIDNMSKYK